VDSTAVVPNWFKNERIGIEFLIARALSKERQSPGIVRTIADLKMLLSVSDAIANSSRMATVWRSLDSVVKARKLSASGPALAHSVHYAKTSFLNFERMTPNERRDYVLKVQKLSRDLAKLLRPARSLSRITWKQVTAASEDNEPPYGWPCPNFGCDWLPNSLEELARAGDTWLQEFEPVVPRPNAANAERLFVIRKLTHDFRRELGQPMRRAVFEIVGTFYDVSDLTPNDITKLAP